MQLRSGYTRLAVAAAVLCALIVSHGRAQNSQSSKPLIVGGDQGIDGRNCDTIKANFDLIAHTAGEGATIIVIGRLGRGESSRELVRRRLVDLQQFVYMTRGISKERIITAEGERVRGQGQVDVYINGKLFIVFRLKRNKDFLTNCEP